MVGRPSDPESWPPAKEGLSLTLIEVMTQSSSAHPSCCEKDANIVIITRTYIVVQTERSALEIRPGAVSGVRAGSLAPRHSGVVQDHLVAARTSGPAQCMVRGFTKNLRVHRIGGQSRDSKACRQSELPFGADLIGKSRG